MLATRGRFFVPKQAPRALTHERIETISRFLGGAGSHFLPPTSDVQEGPGKKTTKKFAPPNIAANR